MTFDKSLLQKKKTQNNKKKTQCDDAESYKAEVIIEIIRKDSWHSSVTASQQADLSRDEH